MKKIVLVGNPNVGKSALFSRLTGVRVMVSNYPGTTVEYTEGYALVGGEQMRVIDPPGVYSLEASGAAEEVTAKIMEEADYVINVVDATNLERNLYLTMELIETGRKIIVALNMSDDLKHRGIDIDRARLQEMLKCPVFNTSGITGQGLRQLLLEIRQVKEISGVGPRSHQQRWQNIGQIIDNAQHLSHRHHTTLEVLEDASVHPFWGIVIGAGVISLVFMLVRFVGEGLINNVFDPFFMRFVLPLMERLSAFLGKGGFVHDVLIGNLIDGRIDFEQSFGVLTTAPYIEFAMVLPYVFSFYLLLSILEDTGYIPRLALILDNVMHKLGLHGFAIIPILLGFGCNVPGILSTRVLESTRERFIAATMISVGVPCASMQAMIFGILGKYGGQYVALVYFVLFLVWLTIGLTFNWVLKGYSPELLLEIPPYRIPSMKLLFNKLYMRMKIFVIEVLPVVLLSVLVINMMEQAGLLKEMSKVFQPLLSTVFDLPAEAIWPLLVGFLRKDIAVGLLLPLDLSLRQLIIASVVLAISFPCVGTLVVFWKELGWKKLLQAMIVMLIIAVLAGGGLNLLL